jgi:hypothetical protein
MTVHRSLSSGEKAMLSGVRRSALSLNANTNAPSLMRAKSMAALGLGKSVGSGVDQVNPPSSEVSRTMRLIVLRQ